MCIFLGMTPKQVRTVHFHIQSESFDSGLTFQSALSSLVDSSSDTLNTYPKGEMGLTPDIIKRMPQWQADKRAFENSMRNLREFNTVFLRKYKKEYRQHMQEQREAKRGH